MERVFDLDETLASVRAALEVGNFQAAVGVLEVMDLVEDHPGQTVEGR